MEEVIRSYEKDEWATKMLTNVIISPGSDPELVVTDGLLRYKNMLDIGTRGGGGELKRKLMAQMHDSPPWWTF